MRKYILLSIDAKSWCQTNREEIGNTAGEMDAKDLIISALNKIFNSKPYVTEINACFDERPDI